MTEPTPIMKVYAVMSNAFGQSNEIHSTHLSEEKAKEKSNQMRRELRFFKIGSVMTTHGIDEELATKWVDEDFPEWLYEVKCIEVEE